MMKLEILENGNILVEKNDRYFLIEKDFISGTLIQNYFVYEDIYNNLENFINEDNNDKYFYGEFRTLEDCLIDLQNLEQ